MILKRLDSPRSTQYWRASRTAFSVDSDPLDSSITRFSRPGVQLAIRSHSSRVGPVSYWTNGTKATFRACSASASTTSGTA